MNDIYVIRNVFNADRSGYTEAGSPVKIEYQLRIVEGKRKLVEVGKSSFYDYIQSHADSVDIHKILERCAMVNDYSYINRMPSSFMDVTNMPKNLAEAFEAVQDANNYFDGLPVDLKKEYNNNFHEFLSDIGSVHFNNVLNEFLKKNNKTNSNDKEESAE